MVAVVAAVAAVAAVVVAIIRVLTRVLREEDDEEKLERKRKQEEVVVVEEVEGEEKVLGVERPAQRSKQVDARLAAHCRRTQAKKRRWCWRRWRRKREGSDPFPRIQS